MDDFPRVRPIRAPSSNQPRHDLPGRLPHRRNQIGARAASRKCLLGAPFPSVSDRLRQDVTGTDMVFLDEKGHDRFSLGEMMPASPGFHGIGSAYGLTIYDPEGNERGGMGFLSNGSTVSRAVIALDRPGLPSTSGDAWGAMVDDKSGFAGTGYITFKDLNNVRLLPLAQMGHPHFSSSTILGSRDPISLAL
jgi:hypothetical protein